MAISRQELRMRWTGVAPLLMHNGHLADPDNPHARALKEHEQKHKNSKTDEYYREHKRLQYRGSLVLVKGSSGTPVPGLTADMIEVCLIHGARKARKGKEATAAILVEKSAPLIYDGSKDPEKLFATGEPWYDYRPVVIQKKRVMRCRPKFDEWSVEFSLTFDTSVFNADQVVASAEAAGSMVGIGDYRPKFGRFEVSVL